MTQSRLTLDDILQELQTEVAVPTKATAATWASRYPDFADEIIEFVGEWLLQAKAGQSPAEYDEERIANWARSDLSNQLYQYRREEEKFSGIASNAKENGVDLSVVARELHASVYFLERLDRKTVSFESIPSSFISALAIRIKTSYPVLAKWLDEICPATFPESPAYGLGVLDHVGEQRSASFEDVWVSTGLTLSDLNVWKN
jgi:hypothetical protein